MEKILISACLVGDKTKYNGENNYNPLIIDLLKKYELVPFCPEVEGGLKTPRLPSEIKKDKVINQEGKDVTKNYLKGAELALNICKYLDIKLAILKETSPSCGSNEIYDGTFSHKKIKGKGITTKLLEQNGIKVINETQIEELLK
ncbi:MAG: DUF523 domain-containing protein [Bacilli bacterium]|nr:DUF523 domain-containing protein [Bacilli bacterium]